MSDEINNQNQSQNIQSQQGQELPPAPEVEQTKKRGRPKGQRKVKTEKIEKIDIEIPLAIILENLTVALAYRIGDRKYIMSPEEAKNIENGFNAWVEMRLPSLSKYYPEIVLFTPIVSYIMRVAMSPSDPIISEEKKK